MLIHRLSTCIGTFDASSFHLLRSSTQYCWISNVANPAGGKCSGLFSNPHLVNKEFVVRSHRKSVSLEVKSFARELIDVVDILTVVKKKSPRI